MNLFSMLQARAAQGKPVRVGLIGTGKFGAMFLAQALTTPGLEVTAVADLSPQRARNACRTAGWSEARIEATWFADSGVELCASDRIDVVADATGAPAAGIANALTAIEHGKHIVMVNLEANAIAGPALAARARAAGVVYSLAYGDQPALTAELVDWARASGFEVIAAGKGTKFLPHFPQVTPDTVWEAFGMTREEGHDVNPYMLTSFTDGTKSAIEMAAVANACNLAVPENGLSFHPCGVDDLAHVLRPREVGGVLESKGIVETLSCLERDGRPVFRDLRWGVYVTFEAPTDFVAEQFRYVHLNTDATGRYAAMYKPYHIVGMELGVSLLSVALRGEPTGEARWFRGDVVAAAKRDLRAGDDLDGEGGYAAYGRLMPAETSVARGALPIGLAHGVKLVKSVRRDQVITWSDVSPLPDDLTMALRRETEAMVRG
ncbi:MAG: Gfo/Idh/MocA family oxidoreductase [Nevskiaceae bacterium]|jgi:predicted homoserine dehydrogenase-like protein|nr:Gfo/Idh/MocA family oxidoreductase [Nevskiaceae bacterium]